MSLLVEVAVDDSHREVLVADRTRCPIWREIPSSCPIASSCLILLTHGLCRPLPLPLLGRRRGAAGLAEIVLRVLRLGRIVDRPPAPALRPLCRGASRIVLPTYSIEAKVACNRRDLVLERLPAFGYCSICSSDASRSCNLACCLK